MAKKTWGKQLSSLQSQSFNQFISIKKTLSEAYPSHRDEEEVVSSTVQRMGQNAVGEVNLISTGSDWT